jgi:hypothetical protein
MAALGLPGFAEAEVCPEGRKHMDDAQILEWFEKFRSAYPKRDGTNPRKPAWERWVRLMKLGNDPADIIAGAEAYAAELNRQNKNHTGFVAMAVTWLNQCRWQDYQPKGAAAALPMSERKFIEKDTLEWDAVADRWRAKNGVSPPQRDFQIGGTVKRGWYFTRDYVA